MPSRRFAVLVPLALVTLAACSDGGPGPRSPASLQVISGHDQQAIAGATLTEPLVVRVNGADGQPLGGVRVTWTVTSGGGSVNPASSTTNAEGLAQTQWTLGSATGEQEVTATVGSLAPARFTIDASSPFATAQCFDSPQTLAVGATVTLAGASAAEICVSAGVAGGEYIAIAHQGDVATDTLRLQALGTYAGAIAELAEETPSLSFAASASRSAPPVRVDGEFAQRRDERFHAALRRRERSLTPMIPAARNALKDRGDLGGLTPRLAIGSANPQIGDLVTINANANSACTNPINKQGRIAAVSQRAIIVHDTENPAGGFTDAEYQSIALTFDTLIHPLSVANFGEPSDIDANGRAFIFYTNEVNKLTERGSGSYVGGFYFVRDLFPKTAQGGLQGCSASNEAEIFYMLVPDPDGTVSDKRQKDFVLRVTLGTIAHEYQHLINASRRMFVNDAAGFEQTWLDEGLAHIAEELTFFESAGLTPGANLDLNDIRSNGVVLEAFNRFGINNFFRFEDFLEAPWTNSPYNTNDQLSTRGAAWHFLRYLADRRGSEQTLWYDLVNSTASGLTNLEFVLGSSVYPWLRDWGTSVLLDDLLAGVPAALEFPSWDLRSIWTANPPFSGSYPLSITNLSSGALVSRSLIGGGATYLRLTLAANGIGAFQIRTNGGTPASDVSVTLVRTR